MKECHEALEISKTISKYQKVSRISKRWKSISDLSHPNKLKQTIDTRIIQYELVLGKVKELYNNSGEACYERDYKHDNENPFTIYSFLTSSFFWEIECDFTYNINVTYQFDNCKHEEIIRAWFKHFNISNYITEVAKQPSLAAFHKAVLGYQKSQFIHSL